MNFRKLLLTALGMLLTLGVAVTIAAVFRVNLIHLLEYPLRAVGVDPTAVLRLPDPVETIIISLTISFYAGLMAALPLLLYFLAHLALPALTPRQEKSLCWGLATGFLFFIGGVLLSIFYVLPTTLRWLYSDGFQMQAGLLWNIRDYYSLALHTCLTVGLLCKLPMVIVTLNAFGLVAAKALRRNRLFGYATCLIPASIIFPTSDDPIMLLLFAVPILLIFEVSICLVACLENRRAVRAR